MSSEQDRMSASEARRPVLFLFALMLCAALFTGLGIWQVKRLGWKEALIAKVERRIHAPAVPAPDGLAAGSARLADDEYMRVTLSGRYIPSGTALVRAVTDMGGGHWVLTPLRTNDGRLVYINRGFVPQGTAIAAVRAATPAAPVSLTGLLRLNEPRGAFLHSNDPAHDRWYSRDVAALAQAHGLIHVAPYFVDAEREAPKPVAAPATPTPGLTVIHFPNNHLVYALTWFSMAALCIGATIHFGRKGKPE